MAKAEIKKTLSVDSNLFFDAVVGYEAYPEFVLGCKKVEVERKAPGQSRVTYHVSMMKDLWYTLDHTEDREKGIITWKLVKSDTLLANEGTWTIRSLGDGKTEVTYAIDIEFNIPVPGFILSKLVKGSLPSMIDGFEKQTKKKKSGSTS